MNIGKGFQLCQHFRNLSASTGIHAGSNGTDRGSENRRGKLLEDSVAGRVSDDKIFVHHIWTDELYYLLQQLYVAVPYNRYAKTEPGVPGTPAFSVRGRCLWNPVVPGNGRGHGNRGAAADFIYSRLAFNCPRNY